MTQPSFDLGAIGSFSFPTPMSIYIWSISLSTPDNIEMSLTTWISLMPISVNWLYRCFTYLGGSFIELTTHAFFILNIAKFKFEKMSKLTKLDWIFFFFLLDITLDKEISWYKLIILWTLNRQENFFQTLKISEANYILTKVFSTNSKRFHTKNQETIMVNKMV